MAILGVDTGGTFTDFLLLDDSGKLHLHKVLSTPHAPEEAILTGLRDMGIDTEGLSIVHGSTVATNAVLEGKGVRCFYVCNTGMADILAIGRQARQQLYELTPDKPERLIPSQDCLEVAVRRTADGESLQALDERALQALLAELEALLDGDDKAAVAINLLFSYIDADDEIAIADAISQRFGERLFISRSSDVLPEYREYERGITTTLNAMVGPLMQQYLSRLQQSCTGANIDIMQSSAGTTSIEHAGRYPVHLLLSGPAGGLLGARTVTSQSRLLTFDMGGTSTDVSLIDGDIAYRYGASIATYPVAVPMVDMHTIGAGGGSIASVDAAGLLLVGPQSAGADPGPACYGKGGIEATVTDANVVLGRLLPDQFLGGGMRLDVGASQQAVAAIGEHLGLSVEATAQGIIDVVNDHMVRALRVMSVQRGHDPAAYTLVSFGGAGGLHVCALAEALDIPTAMVPANAGVLSALGMLAAEQSRERSRTINALLGDVAESQVLQHFAELQQQAEAELRTAVANTDQISVSLKVDVRYLGQSHTLALDWHNLARLAEDFHQAHEASYGHRLDMAIELVTLRVRLTAPTASTGLQLPEWQATAPATVSSCSMPATGEVAEVHARDGLEIGQGIRGPALVTETSATTWIAAGWLAEVDRVVNVVLKQTPH